MAHAGDVTHDRCDQERTDLKTLREVTLAAARIFIAPPRRRAAVTYLKQRGIDVSNLPSVWLFGYAPPGWTRLVDQLRSQFSVHALLDAGIARRSSRGTLIDTFRDRVIVGIRQADGKLAGFIGRDLSGDPNAPKYLNTRHHALFEKGALLYGLYEGTRQTPARQPVIVEGPLDVLAIAARQHMKGDMHLLPIAPCGTAFTRNHARRIATLPCALESPVVVAMDGDAAGREAALTASDHLRRSGLDVRATVLPTGMDPAEYLARGEATLNAFHASEALSLIAVRVQHAIAAQGDRMQWVEGRLAALRSIAGYLATYPASDSARQIALLANTLGLLPSTVGSELAHAYGRNELSRPAVSEPTAMPMSLG
jgi:DNA primase